jgi:hypothetical protein
METQSDIMSPKEILTFIKDHPDLSEGEIKLLQEDLILSITNDLPESCKNIWVWISPTEQRVTIQLLIPKYALNDDGNYKPDYSNYSERTVIPDFQEWLIKKNIPANQEKTANGDFTNSFILSISELGKI